MGLRVATVLCLAFALAVSGQSIFDDLASKENSLNCLLGKPNCVSPPPPPPGTPSSPPPAPLTPSIPPISSPPTPGTSTPPTTPPSTPPSAPPSVPPTTPPTISPVTAPVPAPAPAPSATGSAIAVISLVLPDGVTLTAAQQQALAALIQQALGSSAVVQLEVGAGRKLLYTSSTITLLLTGISDCTKVQQILLSYINGGSFASQAQQEAIQVLAASLNGYACTGASPVSYTGAPALAPGSAPSAGGPGSSAGGPGSGTGSPTGSTPSGAPGTPGGAPVPSPGPAPMAGR